MKLGSTGGKPACVFPAVEMSTVCSPVAIDEAGVDVVGPFHSSDGLQTHTVGLEGHDVHQAVFKLVT